jgi:hypothetical protein
LNTIEKNKISLVHGGGPFETYLPFKSLFCFVFAIGTKLALNHEEEKKKVKLLFTSSSM